ncbi:MAG: hypothetical protein EOO15_24385 [Chitinophagaceae bacterium]|nr:MAG: hypothetical protein EOO15_24385 [Chitinophagaceae bacterium]
MNRSLTLSLALGLLATGFTQCRKDTVDPVNTSLLREDLPFIQQQTKGHWILRRISGGICGSCEHPVQAGSYMDLTAGQVTFGNDSLGVVESGPITWRPANMFGNGYYFEGPSGNGYAPTEIRQDTLLLQQYAADGVTYHYTR